MADRSNICVCRKKSSIWPRSSNNRICKVAREAVEVRVIGEMVAVEATGVEDKVEEVEVEAGGVVEVGDSSRKCPYDPPLPKTLVNLIEESRKSNCDNGWKQNAINVSRVASFMIVTL